MFYFHINQMSVTLRRKEWTVTALTGPSLQVCVSGDQEQLLTFCRASSRHLVTSWARPTGQQSRRSLKAVRMLLRKQANGWKSSRDMGGCRVPGWMLGATGGMVPPSTDGRAISVYRFMSSWNLSMASCTALLNVCAATCWNMGASCPRKSAPTLLKDSPKYMHWPSRESRRPPTPRCRSLSNVSRNSATFCTTQPWKMAPSFTTTCPLTGGTSGSSSEKMARYWVMMSKRWTLQASMVLVMWK